ncbi:C-5 cytosine-specific DNA methylase [Vibrio phage 1.205.O._10N.222.51.A7]|nr:C-5 cytosine-specific DNA methylase [Vibrio phage 1.205.O._10N.222.51.A7]
MNILSLFDGKSSGFTACELAGIEVGTYYSAEIDKYAIKVSDAIHPNQTRLGSVTEWRDWDIDWSSIDMIFGGFPCQAWSMAGKQLGDKDERGMLFWTMLDIMKHVRHHNPKADFLIENVKMKKEFEEYITYHMENAVGDVHKILINSALVSAQNRNRYYWTSWECTQPEDRGVMLADVIDESCSDIQSEGWHDWWDKNKDFQVKKSYCAICNDGSTQKAICMTARQYASWNGNFLIIQRPRGNNSGGVRAVDGKTPTLSANSWEHNNHLAFKDNQVVSITNYKGRSKENILKNSKTIHEKSVALCGNSNITGSGVTPLDMGDGLHYRKLTPRECFRLQTTPEHYIDKILDCGVSNTQLYKIAGNGWTDEVIAHILRENKNG